MSTPTSANITITEYGFQFDLPPPTFRPDVSLGPWLIGLIVDILLTGVIFVMFLEYWRDYAFQDRRRIKTFVVVSFVLTVFKSVIVAATVWRKLITGYASYITFMTPSPWYGKIDALVAVFAILLAQTFFYFRLSALLNGTSRLVLVPIVATMLLSFGSHVALVVQRFLPGPPRPDKSAQTIGTAGLVATDLMISACFCFIMIRSKTGMPRTDSLVVRLIVLSWTCAIIPTICDLGKLAAYFVWLDKGRVYIAFSRMLPKLYVIAMLATLNMRSYLRNHELFHISTEHQLSVVLPTSGDNREPRISIYRSGRPGNAARPRFLPTIRNEGFVVSPAIPPPTDSGDLGELEGHRTTNGLAASDTGVGTKWTTTTGSSGRSSPSQVFRLADSKA